MVNAKRLASIAAVAGLAAAGIAAMPHEAKAWWRGGIGVRIWAPPIVVGPPVYGPPPPVVYAAPANILSARVLLGAAQGLDPAALGGAILGAWALVVRRVTLKIQTRVIDEADRKAHRYRHAAPLRSST